MRPVGDLSRKKGSGLKGRAFLNSLDSVGSRALGPFKRLELRILAPGKASPDLTDERGIRKPCL